jgi:hypothetical protein
MMTWPFRVAAIVAILGLLAGLPGTAAARAAPAGDGALVPVSACGEAWLDWRAERFAALSGELSTIQAEGGDQSAALAVPLRAWAAALRESDPPAALLGVMLIDAWYAEEAAAAWEWHALGGSTGFDREKETRFSDYRARVFAAYAAICPTRHTLGVWTFSDGTVAPATPVAGRATPAVRAEVCDSGWATAKRAEIEELARILRVPQGDPGWTALMMEEPDRAEVERASRPPVAGAAIGTLTLYLLDELRAYWNVANMWGDQELPMPVLLRDNVAPFFADADLLFAAYDTVCGTAP